MTFNDIPSKRMPFRTNSLGLREPEIPAKNGAKMRVLVLGDSYTFGWAIEEEETYPSQIQAQLQKEGLSVEIINGGVPAYGTVQEQDFLESIYSKLRPDFLILGFAMNDAEPQRIVPQDPDQIYRSSKSWMWEDLKFFWIRKAYPGYQTLHSHLYVHDGHYLVGFTKDSPKWKEAKEALAKINNFCRAHNAELLVLILPDMNSHFDDSYQFGLIHNTVMNWAKELKIDAIDVLPAFRGKNNADYYVEGDGHPNKAANQIIARQAVLYLTNLLKTKQN
jgi:lysophospholipase L1-like esterase